MSRLAEKARAGLEAYRQRWKRRDLIARALRSRKALHPVADRTARIRPGDILCFGTIRNEALRLPHFLDHHRQLGVGHFLFVDNDSDDGSAERLAREPDVSLWRTAASYRASRFGMDWINALLFQHGKGHWCLTLDADEILIYPHWPDRGLADLTHWLDDRKTPAFGAMMLDLYPKGPLSQVAYAPGQDPVQALGWFDAGNYRRDPLPRWDAVSIRGGARQRVFFAESPDQAPHLHKTPLIRWHWRYAYLSSTHIALPRRLNAGFHDQSLPTGVLLHTKFLPNVLPKSAEEKTRRQHFTHVERYDGYYDSILVDPDLWTPQSVAYQGWEQLQALDLMQPGDWA